MVLKYNMFLFDNFFWAINGYLPIDKTYLSFKEVYLYFLSINTYAFMLSPVIQKTMFKLDCVPNIMNCRQTT